MGNLIESMKERIKNSGSNKKEVLYFAADSKKRIRFLEELDSGNEFIFHSHFDRGINSLCAETYGKACPLCEEEDLTTVTQYAFNVFDYDTNSVKILLFKATGVTPIPAFIEYFENYGTMLDRDYIVKKIGKGPGSSFVVTPCDKEKFKNKKAKPYGKATMIDILSKAYPLPAGSSEDEDEEEVTSKKVKSKKNKKEVTLRDKYNELDMDDLKSIAKELGMSKSEIKEFEDEEEIIETFFDDYEEEDLEDVYNEVIENEND